jgi:hypothetical protein
MIKTEMQWNGPMVLIRLREASKEINKALAAQLEAHAKVNIQTPFEHKDGTMRGQIDTGAMLNAMRATYDVPVGYDAAVINSMEYAPYQEAIRPFLGPAIDATVADAGDVIESVRGSLLT